MPSCRSPRTDERHPLRLKAIHDFGGKDAALAHLKKLQADKGELLVANGDVQMTYAQSKAMPDLGIWFPAKAGGKPTTFALPYAAGLVTKAPHSANGKKLLDYMLSRTAQQQVSSIGGGFSARQLSLRPGRRCRRWSPRRSWAGTDNAPRHPWSSAR